MKNKEIEKLLKDIKDKYSYEPYDNMGEVYTTISYEEGQLLLSYIEKLESNYKEANESITWWINRYEAVVKQYDDNHKKVIKLENNRDKAIELYENDDYSTLADDMYEILKGGSDE